MNENDVIIDVKDLHKSYGQTEVIKGVDMTVRKGEVICIIGPSGAGKSTTLNAVAGVWPVDMGKIAVSLRAKLRKILPKMTSPMMTAARPITIAPRPMLRALSPACSTRPAASRQFWPVF